VLIEKLVRAISGKELDMIIWGTRGRETEIGTGTFYCPKCDDQKPFTRKKVGNYFTLFFIPLFEIKKLGEYLQCADCNTTFKPEVLNIKAITPEQQQVLMVKRDLASGLSLIHISEPTRPY